jgi:Uma2 family endonuclease
MGSSADQEMVPVPRATRFPVEVAPPPGFKPENPSTWPKVPGRFEYIGGRLYYMTPCGGVQGSVVGSIARVLDEWTDDHPEFFMGTNEAGMNLDGDVRGADAAIWRRDQLGAVTSAYPRVPPVLAVEVAGRDEDEQQLRVKAAWYHSKGVAIVWLVLPETRRVVVIRPGSEASHDQADTLAPAPELPGLTPPVARFFRQLR